MPKTPPRVVRGSPSLPKAPTHIQGFDEITGGGLPRGRSTLVCGGPGCGKTLFAMEFVVRGALSDGEPGVFMSFEETERDLTANVAPLGFDLDDLVARKLLALDHVVVERQEIEETGEYDLEGLFARLEYAIDSVGAKRVVLDTVESLFASLPNEAVTRSELRRLFGWLKDKGVTAVITGEAGDQSLTRNGLEEYVSDCVVVLSHQATEQTATRRMRIAKYRGSTHGANEYPFLIGERGLSVLPITSLELNYPVPDERVSAGVPALDAMLGGQGYYRGSSILISGPAGSGKTVLGGHFVDAACKRGERALFFGFEESPEQILRNLRSVDLRLERWVKKGLLELRAARPSLYGAETHLVAIHEAVSRLKPSVVVADPLTALAQASDSAATRSMLSRLIDFLKGNAVTAVFTSLTHGGHAEEQSEVQISSLMDTWLLLRATEANGERNRTLHVVKSRGMAHSNQMREFHITDRGVELVDVYLGPGGVLTGASRVQQEARDRAAETAREHELARLQRDLERQRLVMEARIAELRAEFGAAEDLVRRQLAEDAARRTTAEAGRQALAEMRQADAPAPSRRRGRAR